MDNVCERAVRTYVPDGKLICPKYRKKKNDSCTGGRTSQNPFLKEERKRKMREKERKLLLFAGTTEGRMLAEYLSKKKNRMLCKYCHRIWKESSTGGAAL